MTAGRTSPAIVADSVNKTFRALLTLLGVTEEQAAAVDEEVTELEEVLVG